MASHTLFHCKQSPIQPWYPTSLGLWKRYTCWMRSGDETNTPPTLVPKTAKPYESNCTFPGLNISMQLQARDQSLRRGRPVNELDLGYLKWPGGCMCGWLHLSTEKPLCSTSGHLLKAATPLLWSGFICTHWPIQSQLSVYNGSQNFGLLWQPLKTVFVSDQIVLRMYIHGSSR